MSESGTANQKIPGRRDKVTTAVLQTLALALARAARRAGFVVTITNRPTQPLRMGGYQSVIEIRKRRQPSP